MDKRHHIPMLLTVFFLSLFMIWQSWKEREQERMKPPAPAAQTARSVSEVPQVPGAKVSAQETAQVMSAAPTTAAVATTEVKTDLFDARISAEGGSLVSLELTKHRSTEDPAKPFVLFDNDPQHLYLGQTGLIGSHLPNHKSMFTLESSHYELKDGENELKVRLQAPEADGIKVAKVYTFHRGSYLIDVEYDITNSSKTPLATNAYFQIMHDGIVKSSGAPIFMGPSIFTGPAFYTEQDKYHKVSFEDIEKGKAKLPAAADNGWAALVEHYFVSAWLPEGKVEREFYARNLGNNTYSAGVILPVSVAPGASAKLDVPLYAGPQEQTDLAKIAPGLDLVVDYGWLTVIASPLFWVLNMIHKWVGNWGWAIIVLTVLLKAIFYPLSATSYKSMAKIRSFSPHMQKLKELHGDDKQRLNQEMMELYKREKINPLGGCLPIVVQIPVFIALYWVLLASVEMRNAPWIGWIVDLSVKDPYYILPLLMGVTMFAQQKLSPAPPDPIQAKVMLFMPILFTGMFVFFPAGLVLYWTVSNLISITQQWYITRSVEAANLAKT